MNKVRTFSTRIDLKPETREKLIAILNQQLADTIDLAAQVKQAHWNVKGANFIALHQLFDDFHESLTEAVDDIAERVTALGGYALGTIHQAAKASRLADYPESATTGNDHLTVLADRFAALGKTTRAAIDQTAALGDADIADLFTGISRDLDKLLWFIEAHQQG
jgi:starvation-inducible DNA-binding protein